MENTDKGLDMPLGKHFNPVVAGLAGAAIGAGVAVVTSKVISNKKMRENLMQTVAHTVSRARKMSNSLKKWKKRKIA